METASTVELKAPARRAPAAAHEPDYALNVVLVYQDQPTREWAEEVCGRVARLVGDQSIRPSWWNVHELNQPATLADAVSKTMRSDVIVVAIRAGEDLPFAFYLWADMWLPHARRESGALVALIGLPDRSHAHTDRAREYLLDLSRRGGLDFLVQERKLPAAPASIAPERLAGSDPAGALAASGRPQGSNRPDLREWGINE
jgi:hypothetical protein